MVYVMHAQNLGEYALKILFFQSDLLDGCGELNGSVEGVHGSEHVILSVGEQKEENAEPDDFAVQVILLDLQFREGGEGVEDGVGQPGIVINDPVGCQENGGGGRGDDDGENHLREFL